MKMTNINPQFKDEDYIRFGRCPVIKKSDGKVCGRGLSYTISNSGERIYFPTCFTYHYGLACTRYKEYYDLWWKARGYTDYDFHESNYEILKEEEQAKQETCKGTYWRILEEEIYGEMYREILGEVYEAKDENIRRRFTLIRGGKK